MRLTQALAIRNLIAKLHPTVPPTPRESQQLLSVLQRSFNRRLDDVHPSPQISTNLRQHESPEHLPDVGNRSAGAANAHLQAILNHPSLGQAAISSTTSSPDSVQERFDAAVLAQSVDHTLIRTCAEAARFWHTNAAALQLGPRISAWFTASDSATQRAFLCDSKLMVVVLPLMYLADMEGKAWDWLQILYEGSTVPQQPSDRRAEDRFVAGMVRESIRRNDLKTAVLEYSEACEYRASRSTKDSAKDHRTQHALIVTGSLVSSAVLSRRHGHGIPVSLYDRLLGHAILEPGHFESHLWPFLPMYHPTSAESRTLYQALQSAGYVSGLVSKIRNMRHDRARKLLINLLDGADLMLTQGTRAKAQFILDFAHMHFRTLLPERESTDVDELIRHARRAMATHLSFPPDLAVT